MKTVFCDIRINYRKDITSMATECLLTAEVMNFCHPAFLFLTFPYSSALLPPTENLQAPSPRAAQGCGWQRVLLPGDLPSRQAAPNGPQAKH